MLESIELYGKCQKYLIESTRKIEQEQRDMGSEELNIIMFDIDQVCDDM